MPPGGCEILRPFCSRPADGAAMGATRARAWYLEGKQRRGRQAGRQGAQGAGLRHSLRSGLRHSSMRVPAALPRHPPHYGRPVAPLSPGEPVALPLRPCRPACVVSVLFRLLGNMPGRGCSHGCAWLAYLRSFRFLLANTRFSAICNNF